MLVGRRDEQAALQGLLADVRAGAGGALVLRGEPGIGKSALLDYAAEQAGDMRQLRATAVESESELAFASLHQLVLGVLDVAEVLPAPQRGALLTAFGLASDWHADRFMISVAALSLLSEACHERPLLCLVDDAHWCDGPSLDALSFVARRISADPIGLLVAARDDVPALAAVRMPQIRVDGLSDDDAAALLDEHWAALDPALRDRALEAARGNPLGRLELPAAGAAWEPGRLAPLGEPLPLTDELERAFLARVHELAPATRALLVLTAAAGAGAISMLGQAATSLGLDPGLLQSGALVELLVSDGPRVSFRHPLVRSAVYHGAAPAQRRAAHRALAQALSADGADGDRRAWHAAAGRARGSGPRPGPRAADAARRSRGVVPRRPAAGRRRDRSHRRRARRARPGRRGARRLGASPLRTYGPAG